MSRIKQGFTIVELIIVITVIGILAAIVIVNYNGVQKRAQDAAVQSDLSGIADQLEAYRLRSDPVGNPSHQFPRTKVTLETLSIKASKSSYKTTISYNMIYCIDKTDYQSYALVAESKSGNVFMMTQDGFKQQSYTESSLTATFCNDTFGSSWGLVSNGMSGANNWQTWVGS